MLSTALTRGRPTKVARGLRRAALVLALAACAPPIPPSPPAPRGMTRVAASFGRTWNALVDALLERGIPIRAIDRASGVVAAEAPRLTPAEALAYADCGRSRSGAGGFRPRAESTSDDGRYLATGAIYNIVVRGDSTAATVRVTARFTSTESPVGCESRAVLERAVEADVKHRAEAR